MKVVALNPLLQLLQLWRFGNDYVHHGRCFCKELIVNYVVSVNEYILYTVKKVKMCSCYLREAFQPDLTLENDFCMCNLL